jgi:phosphoribosylaminoimidazolecarboxamide formyltransferase/IMP cyclohydrolase
MAKNQNALISVYDKDGIVEFADGINGEGFNVYASGGTYKTIAEAGVPATDIAELVGGGAILGHKVVTLSREIAAGLLADLNDDEEMAEMRRLGHPIIHLVCQDSYPLEQAIADPEATKASVLFNTDIGGPNMLREAAKGGRIVLSVAEQRQQVLEWLRSGRPNESEFLEMLASRARYEVARYTMLEAKYWNGARMSGSIALKNSATKYGENPQQADAAFYADNRVDIDPLGLDQFVHVQGMERSYVNITDMDRLLQTSTHIAAGFERNFGEVPPMAIGVKHGNACGAAVADTLVAAVEKMLEGDTRAIFGGVVMVNGEIDEEVAETLMKHAMSDDDTRLLDGVIGSAVTDEALELLSRKKLRVIVNSALAGLSEGSLDTARRIRPVRGGSLEQPNYTFVPKIRQAELQAGGWISPEQERDLALAWAVNATSNSNTITLVKDGMLIGNGVGQQDRVGAAELAIKRALDSKHGIEGAVAVSDSFFPYPDGAQRLVEAGVNVILSTSGSVKDLEVAEILKELGIQSFLTFPDKVARGFYGH